MAHVRSVGLIFPVLLIALVIVGCSGGDNDSDTSESPAFAGGAAATAAPASGAGSSSRSGGDARFDFSSSGDAAAGSVEPGAPSPAGQPGAVGLPGSPGSPGDVASTVSNSLDVQVQAIAALDRIIVRTVDMTLVVQDVSQAVDEIAELATSSGGWVVASTRNGNHTAFISFRVPAEGLDTTLDEVRSLTVEVESESSTAQDVTDEYTDLEARIRSQTASEDALITLLESARTVEDTLKVATELARIRETLESMQGRLNLLAQTSAFSLVNIFLNAEPTEMQVNAGSDLAAAVGEPVAFTATFEPPEGTEDYEIEWDFGDGSSLSVVSRTAATVIEGQRITSAVTHVYRSEEHSPFVVTVTIVGIGDAGVSEGEDTLIATVSEIPVLDVFAGESINVEAGEDIGFVGTFTRPVGVGELTYRWDFGDGSNPVEGVLEEGVTVAEAIHTYVNNRPIPYTATLVISGVAEVGEIEGRSSLTVRVREAEGWVIADWNVGSTFKNGIQALSAVGVYGVQGLIWAVTLSPVWILALIVLGIVRWRVRLGRA